MNVLLATQFLYPDAVGGAGRYVRDLARGLQARGHAVIILAPAAEGQPPETVEDGVRFVRCGRFQHTWEVPQSWHAWRRAFEAIHAKRPIDLIAAHQPLPALALLQHPQARHLPWVYHFHSPWAEESRIWRKLTRLHVGALAGLWARRVIERRVLAQARTAITLSASMKSLLLDTHPAIAAGSVQVIPGCVDVQRFQPAATRQAIRQALSLPADRMILLTVRNLVPRMNLEALIHAVHTLRAQRPDVLLLIGGDGPLRASLAALIQRLQLGAHVRLLGPLREEPLTQHYQAADVFVMPSKALEGFGLATLEALACGTPVVGTPIGGTQELLTQLDVTLLCKDVQAESLAYTLLKTLQRLDRVGEGETLFKQARAFAERFSVPVMAERVEAVYQEAARVRVLHVHTLPVISGSGLNVLETMKAQRDAGMRVELACAPPQELADGKDRQASGLIDLAVQAHLAVRPLRQLRRAIQPWQDARAVLELWQLCRRQRYTIVHTHNSKAGVIGRLAARLAGVPVILHTVHGFAFHEAERPWRRGLYRCLERVAASWCDRLIFISQPLWDWAVRARIASPQRFVKIYSGVDVAAFRVPGDTAALRASFGFGAQDVVVGEIAKLWEGKGQAVLLRAVAQLAPRWPQVKVLIVGDGPLRGTLKQLAGELQLADRVVFTGFRTDVAALTHALDIAVLPSLFEGMGRAILEAQAAGKPIIGSRVGGIPDLIEDRVNGLLVPPGDVAALAAALAQLCQDAGLRERLGRGAQQRLDTRFDVATMAGQVIQLCDTLLREKLGQRRVALAAAAPVSGGSRPAPAPAHGTGWPEARAWPRQEASS